MFANPYTTDAISVSQSQVTFSLWEVLVGSGFFATIAVFAIGRIYDRYRQRRALASALRAELGLITHRFTYLLEAQNDRKTYIARLRELRKADDWDASTQIYKGNVANLERLPFEIIKNLAVLYSAVSRFASMPEESLVSIRPNGSWEADTLVRKICELIPIVGEPLERTSWPWYKRPFHQWHTRRLLRQKAEAKTVS